MKVKMKVELIEEITASGITKWWIRVNGQYAHLYTSYEDARDAYELGVFKAPGETVLESKEL